MPELNISATFGQLGRSFVCCEIRTRNVPAHVQEQMTDATDSAPARANEISAAGRANGLKQIDSLFRSKWTHAIAEFNWCDSVSRAVLLSSCEENPCALISARM